MINQSCLTVMRGVLYILVFAISIHCKKEITSTNPSQLMPFDAINKPGVVNLEVAGLTQRRTSNLFNNWGELIANNWLRASPQHFSGDDDLYATSKKLSTGRSAIPLLLQDFRFEIPSNASIENIAVRTIRFKTGKGSIVDNTVYLVTQINTHPRGQYGVIFLNSTPLPNSENEIVFSQNGYGDNGGLPVDEVNDDFQWTPAMINHQNFGVNIVHSQPQGSVVVYYDLVEIIVQYSLP